MTEISVIICAHNPRAAYLRRVLDALRAQTLPRERWELLLVDNASKEPLASTFDISWHSNGRHIVERELGLAEARRRGIARATTDLFCLSTMITSWILNTFRKSLRIKCEWPMLGVWGSGSDNR